MNRTNQALAATLLVLGIVAGLRFYDELRPTASDWTVGAASAEEIVAVEYRGQGQELLLRRAAGRWTLEGPESGAANEARVRSLLEGWAEGLSPEVRLDPRPSPEALTRYGLDEAQRAELVLRGQHGVLVHLILGRRIAGGGRFVQRAGIPGVYRVRVPGDARLSFEPEDWRDRRLLALTAEEVDHLELNNRHGRFAFERLPESDGPPGAEDWKNVGEPPFRPASRTLDTLLDSLLALEPRQVLRGPEAEEARPAAQLEEPRLAVRLRTREGATASLRLGARATGTPGSVYGVLGDESEVLVLAETVERLLDKDLESLRDTTLLRFRREDARSVEWTEEGRTVRVEPAGNRDWRVLSPAGFSPPAPELNLAANSLLNLQGTGTWDGSEAPITAAAPRISVDTTAGVQTLRLSRHADEQGQHFAVVPGRDEVFVLRGAVVERLLRVFALEASSESESAAP